MTSTQAQSGPGHLSIKGESQLPEDSLELLTYWRTLVKYKWAVIGLGLALALLTGVIVSLIQPVYSSTATLVLEANRGNLLSIEDLYGGAMQKGTEEVQTQAQILRSRELAAIVAKELDLAHDPEFDPDLHVSWLARTMHSLGIGRSTPMTEEAKQNAVTNVLQANLTIAPMGLSNLITISYAAPDPAMAARIANAFANTYIKNDMESKFRMAQQANAWLDEHLAGLKAQLQKSESALQDFRDKEHIIDVNGAELSGSENQLAGLVTNLVAARMQSAEAASAYQQIEAAKAAGKSLDTLPVVLKDPVVGRLKEIEAEKERKVSELSKVYGPKAIQMIQAQADLAQARDSMQRQIAQVVASVEQAYQVARSNERALSGAVSQVKGSIQSANQKQFALNDLQRDVQTNQQLYNMFLQRFKETSAAEDLTKPVARVVDPAVAPSVPVRPKKAQAVLVALALGIALGVGVALLLERLDTTVRTSEEVGIKLGQPILTVLPLLKGKGEVGRRYLDEPRAQFSEAIRTARTGVLLSAIDAPNKVLVVTSSVPGEGKTTFAANLALSHAQTKRVLLIDADMRRPRLSAALGIEPSLRGLSSLVSGEAEFNECVQQMEGSTLHILGAGPVPPNPLELLLSQRFKDLVISLSREYEIVILDSPPVHLVSDAMILATHATGVIFVMKANSTPYQLARRCLRALHNANAALFGVVLNQLDFKKAESHYGDYAGYSAYGKDAGGYYTKES